MRLLKRCVLGYLLIGLAIAAYMSIAAKMFVVEAVILIVFFWPALLWLMIVFSD